MTKAPYKNVALRLEDHEMLRELAEIDQRTMTRQLSILIKKEFDKIKAGTMMDA